MTDSQHGIDRLTKGLTIISATMAGAFAINPLGLPTATYEAAGLMVMILMAYGVFLVGSSPATVNTMKRIVPQQAQ